MSEIILGAVSMGLLWAVMVIGVYITYRILDIADLSVEGTITLGAAVAARLITIGLNPWLATALSLLAGMLGGLITGLLHTRLRIPALLSGILTMIALWSINLRVMNRANLPLLKVQTVYSGLQDFLQANFGLSNGNAKAYATLIIGLCFVIACACILYWFLGTEIGCAVRATGSNPKMSRAQGINTANMLLLGLMFSNGLVGLSGALIAQYQSFADIQMGTGSIVIGLASLIIGEVLFGKRTVKNSLVSVVCGAVVYRLIIAIVLKLGLNSNDLKLFTAITVAVCLVLPHLKVKRLNAKKALNDKNNKNAQPKDDKAAKEESNNAVSQ